MTVATSEHESDDLLVAELNRYDVPAIRGSLGDVLGRFVAASSDLDDADWVVRLTGDNPIPDGNLIHSVCQSVPENEQPDYIRITPDSVPYGVSLELFTVGSLRKADRETRGGESYDREHVTPWIIRNGSICEINLSSAGSINPELRATCDHFSDYLRLSRLFRQFSDGEAVSIEWIELCHTLEQVTGDHEPCLRRFRPNEVVSPELCLGTAQLGIYGYGALNSEPTGSDESRDSLLDLAWSLGIRSFDTAGAYGDAEQVIGRNLAERQFAEPFTITTKVASELGEGQTIGEQLSDSRLSLRTSRLDRVLLHRFDDYGSGEADGWKALVASREKGEIREIGVSVYEVGELEACLRSPDCNALQIPFNLIDFRWLGQGPSLEKINISARSAFLQGLLITPFEKWPDRLREQFPGGKELMAEVDALVAEFSLEGKIELCLGWIKSHHWVDEIVVGIDSPEQLRGVARAFRDSRRLTPLEVEAVTDRLESLVPAALVDPRKWE